LWIPSTPLNETINYRNHSYTSLVHAGLWYDWCTLFKAKLQSFVNFDYLYTWRSHFKEHNGGDLNLSIQEKNSSLARSELGVAASWCLPCNLYLESLLSYVNEARFNGKGTKGQFENAPASSFTVFGTLPQNNLISTTIILGTAALSEQINVHFSYHGEFGAHFIANEVSAEFSVNF